MSFIVLFIIYFLKFYNAKINGKNDESVIQYTFNPEDRIKNGLLVIRMIKTGE
jgi:hypothetical protein